MTTMNEKNTQSIQNTQTNESTQSAKREKGPKGIDAQYQVSFIDKKIYVTKKFLKAAGTLNTPEYNKMVELVTKHPSFDLAEKEITPAKKKRTYEGLNQAEMERFIKWYHSDNENAKNKALNEFHALIKFYDMFHKKEKGSAMKHWFLENYKALYLDWKAANKIDTKDKAANKIDTEDKAVA